MSELEIQKVRTIINCHPGEIVGKEFAERLREEFCRQGYEVELVSMPDAWEENGMPVTWYESLAMPGGLKRRMEQEEALISREPGTLTILCHDWGGLTRYGFDAFIEKQPSFGDTVVLVEVAAPLRVTSDPNRLETASGVQSPLVSNYIKFESDREDSEVRKRLETPFVRQVSDAVKKILTEDTPLEYLLREK